MGFWSALGSLGGLALAPFTGGSSLLLSGIGGGLGGVADSLSNAGQVAGSDAAAAAKGRLEQGQLQQGQDRNAISLYNDQFQNNLKAPSTLASQTAHGDLLANVQPTQFSGLPSYVKMPQISGGLSPSALGPNSRSAGAALSRNALLQLASNKFNLPTAPSLTPLPESSGLDGFNKTLGRIGSYAGALNLPHPSGGTDPNNPMRGSVPGGITDGNIPMDPEDDPNNISTGLDPAAWLHLFGG